MICLPLRNRILSTTLALTAMLPLAVQAVKFTVPPKIAFTDSNNAKVSQTKRVAIAAVVLEFQTQVSAEDITGIVSKRLLNRQNTFSSNTLAGFDTARLQAAADEVYNRLVRDLKAAGFEVVPQAELNAHPTYQKLVQEMAWPQGYHLGNQDGNSIVVGASQARLYLPAMGERGTFGNAIKQVTPYQGPSVGFGERMKQGGASSYSAGREVEVAKALNAHLLKAWYLVGFGQASAETGWDSSTTRIAGGPFTTTISTSASQKTGATAMMYLRDEQTRISLRSPDGDTAYARESSRKTALGGYRPWDGDVVVRLDDTLFGNAAFVKADVSNEAQPEESATSKAAAGVLGGLSLLANGLAGKFGSPAGDLSKGYVTQVAPDLFANYSIEMISALQPLLIAKLKP